MLRDIYHAIHSEKQVKLSIICLQNGCILFGASLIGCEECTMKANIRLFAIAPYVMICLLVYGSFYWKTVENTTKGPKPATGTSSLASAFGARMCLQHLESPRQTVLSTSPSRNDFPHPDSYRYQTRDTASISVDKGCSSFSAPKMPRPSVSETMIPSCLAVMSFIGAGYYTVSTGRHDFRCLQQNSRYQIRKKLPIFD